MVVTITLTVGISLGQYIFKTTLGYAQFLELPISGIKAVAKIATTLNTLHDLYTVEAMTWGMQTALRNSINALWSSKSKVGFWIGVGFNFLNLINFVYSIIDKDTSYSKWTL